MGVRNPRECFCTSFLVLEDADGGQDHGFGTRRRKKDVWRSSGSSLGTSSSRIGGHMVFILKAGWKPYTLGCKSISEWDYNLIKDGRTSRIFVSHCAGGLMEGQLQE